MVVNFNLDPFHNLDPPINFLSNLDVDQSVRAQILMKFCFLPSKQTYILR